MLDLLKLKKSWSNLVLKMCQQIDEILEFDSARTFLKVSPRKLRYLVTQGLVPYSRCPTEQGGNGKLLFLRSELLETVKGWRE